MAIRMTMEEYQDYLKRKKEQADAAECENINMPIIAFEIKGEPVAKARPRVTRFGTFTPQKTLNYENWVKECFVLSYGNSFVPLEGQLRASIVAYFSIPKSKSNKIKAMMAAGEVRPVKKPDGDNIIKIVTDALNKLAYHDDSQLVDISVSKFYSENARVEVLIQEVI